MDGSQQESTFDLNGSVASSELKRISVFDSAVAQTLLIDSGPGGYDDLRPYHAIGPQLAKEISALVSQMHNGRNAIVEVLEASEGKIPQSAFVDVSDGLNKLGMQIDADITTLKAEKIEDALKTLEAERLLLRHKQVLNQLLPDVEAFVGDLSWAAAAAGAPKSSLNPRPLTDKEKELFNTVLRENTGSSLRASASFSTAICRSSSKPEGNKVKLSAHSACVEGTGPTRS
jgi:hypothetical protein